MVNIEEAVRIGLEAAGGKKLGIFSPNVGRQLLRLGLIDEIAIHIVPVLLGDGIASTTPPAATSSISSAAAQTRPAPSICGTCRPAATPHNGPMLDAAGPALSVPTPPLEVNDVSDGLLVSHARRRHRDGGGVMTTVEANGVTLGVEHFGDGQAPLVLLAGGPTMLSWPDALCEALARGGRHVVRYDLRDCGASTTIDPGAPTYTLRDLAADAAALARELDDRPAHLAGIGVGGMVAQIAALDHPDAFSALTLAGTRPVAPGPVDDDLPAHRRRVMV